jgi:hypothetical protein
MPSGDRDHGAPIATEMDRGVSRRLVLASSAGVQCRRPVPASSAGVQV